MTLYDLGILAFYFTFMVAIGWVLRRFVRDVSDYFRGGGKAVWWLAGGSAFMGSFSAWTFTGAASQAYDDGWPIATIYVANTIAFLFAACFFAPRFRQMRVITAIEAVRHRFGPTSEQVFVWLQIPLGTLQAGIGLNALGVFASAVLGFNLEWTIAVTGLVVCCMALLGGSWAVLASDFVQVMILMPVCLVVAVLALVRVGGWDGIAAAVPAGHLDPGLIFDQGFLGLWCLAMLFKQLAVANNLLEATRYLSAKDSRHARWAGLLGAALFGLGVLVWFLPPLAARALWPDLQAQFPALLTPAEGAFIAMAREVMPVGMMGLLVSGIFATTMSSMDSGLNKNAGIFVKNFYQPVMRPQATDREMLWMGRWSTLVLGALVTCLAIWMSQATGLGLFVLMQRVSILVGVPILVPLVLGVLVRRTPPWSAWSTVVVGFACSILGGLFFPPDVVARALGIVGADDGVSREYWTQGFQFFATTAIASAWFLATAYFWRRTAPAERARIAEFFRRLDRPVDFEREEGVSAANDERQSLVIGWLCLVFGAFMVLLMAIPNPTAGRLAFGACSLPAVAIGLVLVVRSRTGRTRAHGHAAPGVAMAPSRETVVVAALTPTEIAEFLPEPMWRDLQALATRVVVVDGADLTTARVTGALLESGADVLVTCWKTPPLPDELPPRLRYVCHLAGSVRRLVSRAHLDRGLLVSNWGSSISHVVAEGALMHVLGCLRRASAWSVAMHRDGAWKGERIETASLFGRRVGLHGFGRVARELVKLLRPFGVAIDVFAPDVTPDVEREWRVRAVGSLEELFRECDVIVELAPLHAQTFHSVQERHLRLIRPGGVFVNVGRGDLVDEEALVRVAREGRVQFGLDVFATEPLPGDHPLRGLMNVWLTPHIAGPTSDRRRDAGQWALRNLRDYVAGRPLSGQVTAEEYDRSA